MEREPPNTDAARGHRRRVRVCFAWQRGRPSTWRSRVMSKAGDTKSATLEVGIALVRGEIHALQRDLVAAIRETTAAITLASLAKLMGPILAASIRLAEFHRLSGQPASSVGLRPWTRT